MSLNLDIKNITDHKSFWKTMKPFRSDKYTLHSKISREREDSVITDGQELVNMFNDIFDNAAND